MSDNEETLALLAALVGVPTYGPRKAKRPRMADEIDRLRAENTALRERLAAVEAEQEQEQMEGNQFVRWMIPLKGRP